MAKQLFANNAKGKLNAGINNVVTALTLQATQGDLFPNPTNGEFFKATLTKQTGEKEIVKVTARSGDTFTTMERDQEGTGSLSFDANDKVECRVTMDTLDRFQQRGAVDEITGNETLDAQDVYESKVVTAEALIDLPDSTTMELNDWIDFKSLTEANVRIRPQGLDTLDGDGVGSPFRLPSFCHVRAVVVGSGEWALFGRPQVEVGDVVPSFSGTLKKGYIWANGVDKVRATLGGLFAVYGTAHGAGDGVTTFGIPNTQGRGMVGQETMGGATAAGARQTTTGLTTTATQVASTVASATGIEKGMYVYGANVAAGTKVQAINGVNVTLSIAASGSGVAVAHRFSWLAQDPQTIGSKGGNQNPQLHNHGVTDPGHSHRVTNAALGLSGGAAPVHPGSDGSIFSSTQTTGVTVNNEHLGDGGNLPPEIVGTMMIKT